MSAADVQELILGPMQQLFAPPMRLPEDGIPGALRQYLDALQSFERDDLRNGWQAVISTHARMTWPVPAVIVSAVSGARKARNPNAQPTRGEEHAQRGKADWDRWLIVRASKLGHDAAVQGVAWGLKCAILNDHKTTDQIDLRALMRSRDNAACTAQRIENEEELFLDGRSVGILQGARKEAALSMYRTLQMQEAETQDEIWRAGRAAA